MWTRLLALLMLPLIAADCLANLIIGGSWRNTLSGEAWHHREHRYWHWTHRAIDAFFFWQVQHCATQARREALHGSVWAAWWRTVRGEPVDDYEAEGPHP